jgi:glycosyltransferase involved in cell wall biosynthesis
MNILIVHDYYVTPGGEDTVVENEINLLKEHGHNVSTFFVYNKKIKTKGVFSYFKLFKNTIYNKTIKKTISEIIVSKNIQIVHCHNTFPLISPSIYKYAKECGCKVYQTIHNFRFLCASADFMRKNRICEQCLKHGSLCALIHKCYHNSFLQTLTWYLMQKKFLMAKGYNYVDKFICLTSFNKAKLSEVIPYGKIVVKPNFCFPEIVTNIIHNNLDFVFLGRLESNKGVQLLIDAFSKENMPNLILIGDGQKYEELRSSNTSKNIKFLGFLPHKKATEILAQSYCLIVPSLWYEGFPMNIVESYSFGIPVIANNVGNLPFVVEDNVTGLLFDGSANSLREKVLLLKNNRPERERLGHNAKLAFSNNYSPEKNYSMLIDIYSPSNN